jgi:hypothetical protein
VTTATTALGTLTIDTIGPQVGGVQLDRSPGPRRARVPGRPGRLDGRSLVDGSNYAFARAAARPGQFLITGWRRRRKRADLDGGGDDQRRPSGCGAGSTR